MRLQFRNSKMRIVENPKKSETFFESYIEMDESENAIERSLSRYLAASMELLDGK